jgi:hypothetical protein
LSPVARYLISLILAAAAVIWILLPRPDKVGLAMQGVVSLAIAVVLVKLAGAVVADPSIKALFAHPAGNGFRPTRPPWLRRSPFW